MSNNSAQEIEQLIQEESFDSNPYAVLKQMREKAPIFWSNSMGGWLITKYEDVVRTFKDTDDFGNAGRLGKAAEYLPESTRSKLTEFTKHYETIGLLHSDPPEHDRLRGLVMKAFNPAAIRAMHARIQEIVDQILDVASSNSGMEVIRDLAWGLPSTVLADLLDAPPESRELFKNWADTLLAFQGSNKPDEHTLFKTQEALVESKKYLTDLIQQRKKNPGVDLLSSLVLAELEGEKLNHDELLNTCITLLAAGQETTTALIGNMILILGQDPALLSKIRNDRSLIPQTIEEIVRFESPIPRQPRLIRKDITVSGVEMKKGDIAFQMLNSANRDPDIFENPDSININRKPNKHLGFGVGAHYCVGAPLSRLEATIVLNSMLDRFSKIELINEKVEWDTRKRNSRVLKELSVNLG